LGLEVEVEVEFGMWWWVRIVVRKSMRTVVVVVEVVEEEEEGVRKNWVVKGCERKRKRNKGLGLSRWVSGAEEEGWRG
jgi:hypothetical protein